MRASPATAPWWPRATCCWPSADGERRPSGRDHRRRVGAGAVNLRPAAAHPRRDDERGGTPQAQRRGRRSRPADEELTHGSTAQPSPRRRPPRNAGKRRARRRRRPHGHAARQLHLQPADRHHRRRRLGDLDERQHGVPQRPGQRRQLRVAGRQQLHLHAYLHHAGDEGVLLHLPRGPRGRHVRHRHRPGRRWRQRRQRHAGRRAVQPRLVLGGRGGRPGHHRRAAHGRRRRRRVGGLRGHRGQRERRAGLHRRLGHAELARRQRRAEELRRADRQRRARRGERNRAPRAVERHGRGHDRPRAAERDADHPGQRRGRARARTPGCAHRAGRDAELEQRRWR